MLSRKVLTQWTLEGCDVRCVFDVGHPRIPRYRQYNHEAGGPDLIVSRQKGVILVVQAGCVSASYLAATRVELC